MHRLLTASGLLPALLLASIVLNGSAARAQQGVDCLVEDFAATPVPWPDYGASNPVVLPSCTGTNSQSIDALDRVVFLGDSLAVGTPPSTSAEFFRSQLADRLVAQYGLAAPSFLWKNVDPFAGTSTLRDSGDFSSCGVWGARADDLLAGGMQIQNCFPANTLDQRTLVVIAIGANDFAALASDQANGATMMELQATLDAAMAELRAAVEWLVAPGRFPNGVFVVIANPLDFTDGSGDVSSCPGAAAAGVESQAPVADLIAAGNAEILDIVVDNGIELVFARERFCGHGWDASDPTAPCYRGPGNANWFDSSCIHPNPTGHVALADDFLDVITTPVVSVVPALAPIAMVALVTALAGAGGWWLRRDGRP